jgi:hypothetical protein
MQIYSREISRKVVLLKILLQLKTNETKYSKVSIIRPSRFRLLEFEKKIVLVV